MGELHLEIMHDRIEREYGVPTRMGRPQVVHRETVVGEGVGEGRIERVNPEDETDLIFGAATVRVRALPRGSGVKVRSGGAAAGVGSAEAAARRRCRSRSRRRSPASRRAWSPGPRAIPSRISRRSSSPSSRARTSRRDVGWRIAAQTALRKAIQAAGPAMLEPIMDVEVVVPEEFLGAVVGDLSARRAQIEDVGFRGQLRTVNAKLPLKALFGYSTAVRSASQGRATFTMRFAKFDAWS